MMARRWGALLLLTALSCLSSCLPSPGGDEGKKGYIWANVTQEGLDFAKEVLIREAVSSLTALHLPDISRSFRIPFVGGVEAVFSCIILSHLNLSSSSSGAHPGDTGIAIIVTGATANITMKWRYTYSSWLIPVDVSDEGSASVRVEGMQAGITLRIENHDGFLKLVVIDCGSVIENIFISLDGGASWFYQGWVDAFEEQIRSSVETAVVKRIKDGILKINLLLARLPSEITVDSVASLNVTFMDDPLMANETVGFEIDGLFTESNMSYSFTHRFGHFQHVLSCEHSSKMLGISVDEAVFNSASDVYFKAGVMNWIVDKLPDQSLLNTAGWRFIVPQLYKKYPNDEMELTISVTSPPLIRITAGGISSTISADMTIDVIESNQIIPVACVYMVISASGTLGMSGSDLAGEVRLDGFTLELKWSDVGNFHMYLIQTVVRVLLKDVFIPYVNTRLSRGFPLPVIHGFALTNSDISLGDSNAVICTDLASAPNNSTSAKIISSLMKQRVL
ncbi:putative BPI/LBP family protein At1g04970 [Nymphaea colorata]|nr:putative BPI/LBP family protein At1g04970 [Nymphaea colorata]